MTPEDNTHDLDNIQLGHKISIRDETFNVVAKESNRHHPIGLVSLDLSSALDNSLTEGTSSTLYVEGESYLLSVDNGPTYRISSGDVAIEEQ